MQPTKRDLTSYGFIALSLAFVGLPLYIYVPDFYATEFGVSLTSLGAVLLLLRIFDAVSDPAVGYLSDAYSQYRFSIVLVSSVCLAGGFFLLFNPLVANITWFAVLVFLTTGFFSIVSINTMTMGGLWGNRVGYKTTIVSYREFFAIIGLMSATMLPNILQHFGTKQAAFFYFSLIMIALLLPGVVLYSRWQIKYKDLQPYKTETYNLSDIWQAFGRDNKRFFTVYFISTLASAMPAVLAIFFIRDLLKLEQYTGLFLCLYFLSGAMGMVFWNYIARQSGKHRAWMLAMVLAVGSFFWACYLEADDFMPYLFICLFSGIAFGAELIFPPSILADAIENRTLKHQATLYFGLLAFFAKLALATASGLSLWYLGVFDFVPAGDNGVTELNALITVYALIPSLMKCVAIYMLWRMIYEKTTVDRSHHHAI